MREAIKNRVSRRNFTGEPLSASSMEMIRKSIAAANEKSGLNIEFVEDGSIAFLKSTQTTICVVQLLLLCWYNKAIK